MDEVDALCPRRDSGSSSHNDQERRVVSTFLSMMDSLPTESRIFVIGVTNRYYLCLCVYQFLSSFCLEGIPIAINCIISINY